LPPKIGTNFEGILGFVLLGDFLTDWDPMGFITIKTPPFGIICISFFKNCLKKV